MDELIVPKYLEEAEKKLYERMYNAIENDNFDSIEKIVTILKKLSLI